MQITGSMCVAIVLLPLWNGVGRLFGVGMYFYMYYYYFLMMPGEYSITFLFAWIQRKIESEGRMSTAASGSDQSAKPQNFVLQVEEIA